MAEKEERETADVHGIIFAYSFLIQENGHRHHECNEHYEF